MKIHLLQEDSVCWITRTSLSNIMRFLFRSEIARQLGASKSGVNDFLRAFDKCESLSYPLPPGITNYGIAELVYGSVPGSGGRNENIEYNCKQAVIVNQDWIEPELNKDYADWADHYGTAILPAKVRKPKFKSSVENAVGILEKGFFHKLEERQYFSLEQFNKDLWNELKALNKEPFKKKNITDNIIGRKRNLN